MPVFTCVPTNQVLYVTCHMQLTHLQAALMQFSIVCSLSPTLAQPCLFQAACTFKFRHIYD